MRGAIVALAAACLACACAPPLGLDEPSSRSLEQGAADSLSATTGYEMTGHYTEDDGSGWAIDLQVSRPDSLHVLFNGGKGGEQLEAIITGGQAYFRGRQFLADHLGSDPAAQNLAQAAGGGWWRSAASLAPKMPDLTDGATFRATFLGSAASRRTDHVAIDGVDSVELSGQRADVYIAEAAPHRLVRLAMKHGVAVDGVGEGDLHFANYNRDFHIQAPSPVIDFSNLSTLPPAYTVVSVDTTGCASPCVVTAALKNLGGSTGAQAPSTVTFTMTDAGSSALIGRCEAAVSPDVGYNATTTVSCTIPQVAGRSGAIVTAVATNPGHA